MSTENTQGSDRVPLKRIAGFELLEKIGQGAMGAVFKARQKSLDRIVALKLLPPKIAKNKSFIQRFVREARASAKLSHPNVVAGIDVGQDGPTELWYFAMEFVNGPTTRELLKKKGRLPEDQALKIARDIASALECARRNGLVHRDVKPDNILLNEDGTAKLADLGLVRHEQDDAGLTQSGSPMGTPFYMAPELVRGQVDNLDTRADLYGLGATLFHLVTGQPPFQGETSAVVMAQHLSDASPMANRVCSEVSYGCSKLIQKLMQKEKSQRLQTPQELIEQIDRLLKRPATTRGSTTGPRVPVNGATTTGARSPIKTTGQRSAIRPRGMKKESRPSQNSAATLYVGIAGGVALLVVVFMVISSSRRPQARQNRPSRVTKTQTGPSPAYRERPAASHGPDLEQRWRQAKAFAQAHPGAFDQILQRYQQVADEAAGHPLAIEIRAASTKAEANYEKAAQEAWQLATQKIDECVAVGDYDGALATMEALPPTLAARLIDQVAARRQALEDEANGKIAPVLERALAASAAADPAAGLAALAEAPALKFQPAIKRITELKQRLERELADVDQLRARKAQLEAGTKLAEFLRRFDTALLSTKDEAAAGQAAREAKAAKELDPVRAQADAMAAILDAAAAERKRQEEAATSLKGKPFMVGMDSGTIERIAGGVLYVKISMGDGKITGTKKLATADLTREQKNALFPPLTDVPAALTVHQALRKLITGREDLDGADALLASVPDFPLTPHYLACIEAKRTVLAESLAEKAWTELANELKKPLAEVKQALPLYEKLQAFLQKYGATEFARNKAAEITAVKAELETIAAPNSVANGDFESGDLSGWRMQPFARARPIIAKATEDAAHSGKFGMNFLAPGMAHCRLSTVPGQTYRVSCWVKSIDAFVRITLDNNAKNPATTRRGRASEFREWRQLSFTFTASQTEHSLSLLAYDRRRCRAFYDDIEVVKLSEGAVPPVADRQSQIPADAHRFNGHAYKVFQRAVRWEEARDFCKQQGGYLACIETAEETRFLAGLAPERTWVGGLLEDGEWTWINGAHFDRDVGPMGGVGRDTHQPYLSIIGTRTRYADTVRMELPFACEWEPATLDPEPVAPAPQNPPGATGAQFVGEDEQTQGDWKQRFGKDGFILARGQSQLPAYATLSTPDNTHVWEESTDDRRALERARGEGRFAACWYGRKAPADFDLKVTDGREHTVSFYLLDFKTSRLRAKAEIVDTATGAVLDTRVAREYRSGRYLTWRIKGSVRIRFASFGEKRLTVVSGVFFQ